MLNKENDKEMLYSNPHEFYNNENVLSEEVLNEYEEIDNNELYTIKTIKITYENGKSVIVTKKIINDKTNNLIID